MSLCFSGDCCCEAALCGGEYFNCSKPIQLGTKKKLVFRVLKRQNSRSFRGFLPWTHWGPNKAPKPQLNFPPPNINYFPTALSLQTLHFIYFKKMIWSWNRIFTAEGFRQLNVFDHLTSQKVRSFRTFSKVNCSELYSMKHIFEL